MSTLKDKIIEAGLTDHVLTDVDLNNILEGTAAARYGMVNKALKQAEMIKLRRGLYMLADKYRHKKLSKHYLASRIVPHSYISLESALSYHGWIPEHVATVTSVLAERPTRKHLTIFGEFIFYQLPVKEYEFLTGINRVEEIKGEPFFIASPLRALADYIYIKKIDWQGIDYLSTSLRIEIEEMKKIKRIDFSDIKKVYRSKRVLNFLDNLKQELK
jgi:predicted transcriptional regulator of viral defense system